MSISRWNWRSTGSGSILADDEVRTFRGERFTGADFTGATFRECSLNQVTIIGSMISDLRISGFAGEIEQVVVNDVDVSAFVTAELDRRNPERLQLRAVRTAADHRAMWDTVEQLWSATIACTEHMPEWAREARVGDEWSLTETLRHLVFATDVWAGRMVLGRPMPYHPLGLPPTDYSPSDAAAIGIQLDARPTFAEVIAARADRLAIVRGVLAEITDADLESMRTAEPAQGWGEETLSVRRCLRVILNEECEHHRYAVRDLDALDTGVAVS